ncbi:unnamed protein product [Allacma fusca]|uniref:Uncharacterized protein n=1 Tax=Allacma fusca TaxID=39272 RepID=A0A8J2PSK1_9HEXA|nr:unnamed protein product [Allacma fusca]
MDVYFGHSGKSCVSGNPILSRDQSCCFQRKKGLGEYSTHNNYLITLGLPGCFEIEGSFGKIFHYRFPNDNLILSLSTFTLLPRKLKSFGRGPPS